MSYNSLLSSQQYNKNEQELNRTNKTFISQINFPLKTEFFTYLTSM